MTTSSEDVYIKYEHVTESSPGSITFWSDPAATQPWSSSVPYGGSTRYTMNRSNDSDAFDFDAVTFWNPSAPISQPAGSFRDNKDQSTRAIGGISISDIDTKATSHLDFTVNNNMTGSEDQTLSFELTLRDTTDNKSSKNNLYTSRDPHITLDKPGGP